jgi:phosphoribosyl 1,2-cyclic phosphate phosphodiesterase
MDFVFLGTSAGCGVPAFYCGCPACQEALTEPRCRRSRCAVMINGKQNLLIDTPPDLAVRLAHEKIRDIDYIALTHGHYDHIGGLGDVEFYIRLRRKKPLPTMMTRETWEQVQNVFSSITELLEVRLVQAGETVKIGEIGLTAIEAAHSPGTLGFLITHNASYTAYLPDTGKPPPETLDRLKGIGRLILDTTFWGKNWYPGQHLSIDESIALGQSLQVQELYLTHLSMHCDTPVTNRELEEFIRPYKGQVKLAYDGLRLVI